MWTPEPDLLGLLIRNLWLILSVAFLIALALSK